MITFPHYRSLSLLFATVAFLCLIPSSVHAEPGLRVIPREIVLRSPEASHQLLVLADTNGELAEDLTRQATYTVLDPELAQVTARGEVLPQREGVTQIRVRVGDRQATIALEVTGLESPPPISFRREVMPILTKAACNSGGCHGKAEGQNGFKLSVFGFDSQADYDALLKEGRGRRVSLAAPSRSLLLQKATGQLPHGGGIKIIPGSPWHRRVQRWIEEGARLDNVQPVDNVQPGSGETPIVQAAADSVNVSTVIPGTEETISVTPQRLKLAPSSTHQLQVTALGPDGLQRCVTGEAEFQSNAGAIAAVDTDGLITVSDLAGEAAILVRYRDQVAVCRVTVPRPQTTASEIVRPAENNFVDGHVWDKLEDLGIEPSPRSSDEVFLRRVYLDTIGTLPTVEEARRFLSSDEPDKRRQLIDQLLERPEYADYWAVRWADILRVDQLIVAPQGAVGMTRWLKRQFEENTSYDQLVRSIVTARGNTWSESPAAFYQVHSDAEMAARAISQVFLGVRIECAQCHHHPFEKLSQADYFSFAGFLTGIGRKPAVTGGQKIFAQAGKDLLHPRTGEAVAPAGFGASPASLDGIDDRRQVLAEWMTSSENPYFARMIVNRLWAHYFARGLVEPIDDLRVTNPATNEPLFTALAEHVVASNYDLKAFTRTLLNSRTYQSSARPNESNRLDEQNFSRASWKPLEAEVLLDAITEVTGVAHSFNGWPEGYRAIEVWDNRTPSYFFRIFGKPQRVSVCECERGSEPSIAQALHLMNSSETIEKIRHRDGRAARLARSERKPSEVIEELYLATLARYPSEAELTQMLRPFAETDRRTATEDVLWALLNTQEFLFNH